MHCLPITETSQVASARRLVSQLAEQQGVSEPEVGKLALLATEIATNLAKHATGGQLLVRLFDDASGIELLALDSGPGMRNVQACLRDGYSTAGSLGTGLGAICRLASHWDIYSVPDFGTALLVQVTWPPAAWSSRPAAPPLSRSRNGAGGLNVGVVCLPMTGERACGDGWAIVGQPDGSLIIVADGLGHGPQAAEAAQEAIRILRACPTAAPELLLESMHRGLRPTRGAAVGIAAVDRRQSAVTFVGVGNIAGTIVTPEKSHRLLSHNGIVGHQMRKVQAFTYPWSEQALLILHSDGLGSRWDLAAYPGLARRHPGLIAGVLYRDFGRGRDDVTVLVVAGQRDRRPAAGSTPEP